jgi:hypothetical protein
MTHTAQFEDAEQIKTMQKQLATDTEIICLDNASHQLYLALALAMLHSGQDVKAKITETYTSKETK